MFLNSRRIFAPIVCLYIAVMASTLVKTACLIQTNIYGNFRHIKNSQSATCRLIYGITSYPSKGGRRSSSTRETNANHVLSFYSPRYRMRFQHSCNLSDRPMSEEREESQFVIKPGCTVFEAITSSIQLLQKRSVPEPEESVLHLLSSSLGLSWETGYRELRELMEASPSLTNSNVISPVQRLANQSLTSDQSASYNSMLDRRLRNEPIQYIIGKWDFHMLNEIIIRRPMLCPRPETEELVEFVLRDVERLIKERESDVVGKRNDRIRILDVGAGTGAIGIAIATQYPNDVQVVALDVLNEAVELSNENAEKFVLPLIQRSTSDDNKDIHELYHAILCSAQDFTNKGIDRKPKQDYDMGFDIVVSNPPYIPSPDMDSLSADVVEYESHRALCGGNDGLDIIRVIVERLGEWMSRSNNAKNPKKYCWLEVDDSHPRLLEQWLACGSEESVKLGVEYCQCQKDFCGKDRFVKLQVL